MSFVKKTSMLFQAEFLEISRWNFVTPKFEFEIEHNPKLLNFQDLEGLINLTERDENSNQVQYPASWCHTAITKKDPDPKIFADFDLFLLKSGLIGSFQDLDLFMVELMVARGHWWSFAAISRSNTAHTSGILSQIFSKFYHTLDYVISIMSRVSLIGHWKILIGCDTCRARIINHWPKNQFELVLSHLLIEQVI